LDAVAREHSYRIPGATASVLGHLTGLSSKLTYDQKAQAFRFNSKAVDEANKSLSSSAASADPSQGGVPDAVKAQLAAQQQQSATTTTKDKDPYGVDIPVNSAKGITFADTNSKLSFDLIPQFKTDDARQTDSRVVYPVAGTDQQVIYTLKNNGVKEDIVLNSAPTGGALDYAYTLKLPDTLVAKLLSDGSVGIYSADPALFGEISASTPEDQQKVEDARKNAAKDFLVFGLPAPVIHQAGSAAAVTTAKAHFELSGTTLRVKASGLSENLNYPVSVDPSIVVSTTADFAKGNNEGNIDFSTADQINRGGLTGGTTGAWATTTAFTGVGSGARFGHTSIVYNGYVYIMGGHDTGSNYLADTLYAPINSNGTLGSWATTSTFAGVGSGARMDAASVVYNGYVYIIGGRTGGIFSDVLYAPVNSNGTLGTWAPTSSMSAFGFRDAPASVAYNGYVYVFGGNDGSTSGNLSSVLSAKLKADGTLSSWAQTTSLPTGNALEGAAVYNGYVYITGGVGFSVSATTYYASLNDGTVGSWNTATSFSSVGSGARYGHGSVINNGYLYVYGGTPGGGADSDTLYAPIFANGSLGSWNVTTSFSATGSGARSMFGSASYNGYIYMTGGQNSAGTGLSETLYAKINPAGITTGYTTNATNFGTARRGHTSVAYNGYLYVIGGFDTSGNRISTVEYATINANGSLTWNGSTGSFSTARANHASVAYNGYLYVLGGFTNSNTRISAVEYATINSNGTLTWNGGTASFSTPRESPAAVVNNGRLYILGGSSTGSDYLNTVEYATINSGGTLTWVTSPAVGNFTTGRQGLTSVISGNYLYAIGGFGTAGYLNSVEYATINPNGTLTWNGTTSAMITNRGYHTSVIYNGYIYSMGGCCSLNTAEYAVINSNGTLGAWTATTSFATGRYAHSSVVYNGYVYVIGGAISGQPTNSTTEYALINNGGPGTTGTWTSTNTFTTARYEHGSVAYNGFLYVYGGTKNGLDTLCRNGGSSNICNDVQYAPINANGTVGSWATTTYMPIAHTEFAAVAYNGYLYALGAAQAGGADMVDYALICTGSNSGVGGCSSTAGSVGTWNSTNVFSLDRAYLAGFAYNGYMYVSGGVITSSSTNCKNGGTSTYCNDIQYAQINSNGSLGSWSTLSSYMPIPRRGHTMLAYGSYVYVIGGDGGSSGLLGDVQYAPINSDGTIGSWTATKPLNKSLLFSAGAVSNGYLYLMGGQSGASGTNLTQYASINANGSLNDWGSSGNTFTTARTNPGAAIYNGYVYVDGGYGGGAQNDVQYATLNAQSHVGTYSKLFDLGSDLSSPNLVYNGARLGGGVVNLTVKMATSASPTFGAATTYKNVTPGATTTLSGTGRYIQVTVNIDDSNAGAFADSVTGQSYITDITVSAVTMTSFYYAVKPTSGTAGSASTVFTVGAKDDSGNVMAVPSNTTVYLYSSSGTGAFSATSGGTYTSALSVVISSGGFTADFYYKDNTAGSPTIYASDQASFPSSDTGIVDATTGYTVVAAAASVAVLSPSTQTVTANNPSSVYTLTTKDAFGNVSSVTANKTFALSDASSGQFSVLSTPFTPVGNVTVNNGSSSTTFFYKASAPGSYTIGAVLGGFTSGSTGVTVNQATITSYYYTTTPSTGTAGSASTVFTVGAHDTNGNVVVVASNTPVYLYSSGSGGLFSSPTNSTFTATSATITAGGTTTNFYYKNNSTSGSPYTITVSDNVTAPDGGTGIADATTSYAVTAGAASQYTLTPPTQTVTANNPSSVITLTTKDGLGNVSNVVGDQTFALSDGATGQFSLTSSPFTPVTTVTVGGGTSSVTFYYRATLPGVYTITPTLAGFSATSGGNAVMTVNQAAITQYYFTTAPASGAAGAASSVFTVGAKDVNGNVVVVSSNTPVYLYSSGSGGLFSSPTNSTFTATSATITAGSATADFYYKNNSTSGSPYTITASDNVTAPDGGTGITDATTSYSVNPGTASVAMLSPSSQSATAGSPSSVITLTTKDSLGNTVAVGSNTTFTLSDADGGQFSLLASPFSSISTVTVNSGSSTATFYYRNNTSGSYTLTAHNAGFTDGASTVTVNSGAIASYYIVSAPSSVNINVSSAAFTVGAHDVFGNTVTVGSNTTVYLYSTHGSGTFSNSGSGGPFTATSVTITTGNSTANFNYKDPVAATGVTITASDQTPTHTPDTGVVDANTSLSVVDPDVKVGPNLPIPDRSATLDDSRPGDPNVHLSWNSTSVSTIKAIRIQVCTDGLKNVACTGPTGADLTPVTLTNTSGELGFSGWSITSVISAHEILITNTTGAATTIGGTSALDLGNFVNPTSIGTFFFRISTYTTTAAAPADSVSYGAIASSTNRSVTVTSEVNDALIFRVANTITSCDGTSETNIPDPNDAASDLVNLSPDPASANTTSTGTAQFCVVTNAPNGYVVTYADWGANSYDGHAGFWNGSHEFNPGGISAFTSTPGVEQFGFKVSVAGAGSGTVTAPYNASTYNYNDSGSAVQIASASASSAANIFTVSYVANITSITPGGTYRAHQMFVVTATF
jgi:hypothetical protein